MNLFTQQEFDTDLIVSQLNSSLTQIGGSDFLRKIKMIGGYFSGSHMLKTILSDPVLSTQVDFIAGDLDIYINLYIFNSMLSHVWTKISTNIS